MRTRSYVITTLLALMFTAPAAAQMPNRLGDLQAERAKYGATLSAPQAGELLNAVAWKLRGEGFGLLRKDGGNRCPVPNSAVTIACDWLVHRPSARGCDVLVSGPDSDPPANGPATPTWCAGEPFDVARFVEPVDPGTTPPPPPPGDDLAAKLAALDARVVDLEKRVRVLETATPPPPGSGTPPALVDDVRRIRELLEAVAKRFGVQ